MDNDFLISLYATFKEEADEYFKLLQTELARLKQGGPDPERLELIQTLYRAAHTIKGAARAVEAPDVEQTALAIETSFKPLRGVTPVALSPAFFAQVDAQVVALQAAMDALPTSPDAIPAEPQPPVAVPQPALDTPQPPVVAEPQAPPIRPTIEQPVPQAVDLRQQGLAVYDHMRACFDGAREEKDAQLRSELLAELVNSASAVGEASNLLGDDELSEICAILEGVFELLREHPTADTADDSFTDAHAYMEKLAAKVAALNEAAVGADARPEQPAVDVPAAPAAAAPTAAPAAPEPTEQDDFDRELQELFRTEAESYLTTLGQSIIRLEQAPAGDGSKDLVAEMYRLLHSLKGNARAVSNQPTETICQAAESLFSSLKKGRITLSLPVFDVVHEALSLLEVSVSDPQADGLSRKAADLEARMNLLAAGFVQKDGADAEPKAEPAADKEPDKPFVQQKPSQFVERRSTERLQGDTLRIVASKLNSLVLKIEELLSVKLSMRQRISDLRGIRSLCDGWEREWSHAASTMQAVRLLLDRPDTPPVLAASVRQLLDIMTWHQRSARTFANRVKGVLTDCESDSVAFNNMITDLQDDSKKLLLAPVTSILGAFPRSVREIARSMGKEVVFTTFGTTVEVDRRVLEGIKDPLLHIIRNSVYHGLEAPEVRVAKGKNPTCSIVLTVQQVDANKVEIAVADDGAGIDLDRVRKVAVERGMPQADVDRLTEQEVVSLIFQSDFSTSKQVGDIAGRGLGLAIVREHVQNLGGVVLVEHAPNVGTRFILRLPLSMATSRGVLVRLGEQNYVLPTPAVQRVVRVNRSDIRIIEERENIVVQGFPIPLASLREVLGLPRNESDEPDVMTVVIVEQGDRRIALDVDAVLNEQEVLVKNFPSQLEWVPNIAACTVLGSGDLALILRVGDLIDFTFKAARASHTVVHKARKSVLVVDDSATSRGLLTQVLGHAGYDVSTAVDGADALAMLLSKRVDIVLSDVEMPRMNGYALVERVRSEKNLADIPVILLSTLDAEEDKKKGLKAGANAYLAKGGFNQTVLLNTISRLA